MSQPTSSHIGDYDCSFPLIGKHWKLNRGERWPSGAKFHQKWKVWRRNWRLFSTSSWLRVGYMSNFAELFHQCLCRYHRTREVLCGFSDDSSDSRLCVKYNNRRLNGERGWKVGSLLFIIVEWWKWVWSGRNPQVHQSCAKQGQGWRLVRSQLEKCIAYALKRNREPKYTYCISLHVYMT